MIAAALNGTLAVTRAWLNLYTSGLPANVALSRRAEVESDLWEMQQDSTLRRRLVLVAVTRMVAGIPDDLVWRTEHAASNEQLLTRRLTALVAAAAIVISLWAAPIFLLKGRRELVSCAGSAAQPTTTAALRHDVIRCAGAFFASRN